MATSTSIPFPDRSLLLGVLSGARSMTPIAMLALYHDRPSLDGSWRSWPVFRSPSGRNALLVGALRELVADKLPMTPSRTTPGPLIGRAVNGAIAGAAIGTLSGRGGTLRGAALGAAGGLVGSFAGKYLRSAGTAIGLPDLVFALLEDAVTIAGAATLVAE
jgi:uncharacterized membrane protein